ncbi:DUF4168 domain-containing protein [Chamaesiphon sp.]|uniref:DUF4168 domain-containing protein n=1 Tax=Chamaesiphon sp. TaxID=2814140 RepID=UPI0035947C21
MIIPHTQSNFLGCLRPLLLALVASSLSLFGGIVPDFTAQQPHQIFSNVARADDFSDQDLRNYAAAVVKIESIRQSTLAQVSRAMGGNKLPNLLCDRPNTMDGLNSEAKSLFINYCNQSESIAASHQLSIEQFNRITEAVRSNPQLQDRVRSLIN